MKTKLFHGKYPIPETAKYVVDYVCDNTSGANFYYQLVRVKDDAILFAYEKQELVCMEAWKQGIPYNEVAFI